MRKYHRWISVFVGVFILFIAVTGVLSQVGVLVNNGGFETEESKRAQEAAADAAIPAGFVCPETMSCRVKRTPQPGEWNVGYLHHLHSGEEFGTVGVVISILSGLGLIFFAISGLWMYIQMFRARAGNGRKGLFW